MNTATELKEIAPEKGASGSSAGMRPAVGVTPASYRVRLAANNADLRAAQLLRFLVFNLELREGLEQSYASCLDADAFDPVCDHLIVEDLRTGEVVGTYRLQTGRNAAQNFGYYSAQEFDFHPFEPLRNEIVEAGRACVHSQHRNFTVLGMLWKGVANYVVNRSCRYLVGCSSLTSQDPAVGIAAYRALQPCLVSEEWRTQPLAGYACVTDLPIVEAPKIPKLLTAYLGLGAKICGPPALDREFKTIDFLTFLDIYSMPAKTMARYLG